MSDQTTLSAGAKTLGASAGTLARRAALAQLTAPGQPYELAQIKALGRPCRAFVNAPSTLRDLYQSTRSDAPFLVFEDEQLSYEQVWRRACRLAQIMVETYGVTKGDRVAVSMRNYPEWIIAFDAITAIGAVAVAMNALWQPDELAFALNDSTPRLALFDQERLERFKACEDAPRDMGVIAVRTTAPLPPGCAAYEQIMAGADTDQMPQVEFGPDDDATMLYTSGSTGHPKGAVSTHRNVISALLSWELDWATMAQLATSPVEPAQNPVALLAVPLFHVSGLHVSHLSSYRAQRKLVMMYKWDAEKAAELIERERVTSMSAPAAMTGDLVEVARRTERDLTSLVALGGGGASRAPEQVRAIDRELPNATPNIGWGMTETNAIGTGHSGADYLAHPTSAGRVSPVLDIRVVDEAGHELGPDQRGELQVRGTSIMRGYWNRPDANASTFDGDWMRTGDVATIDEDGFMYIVDRIKDLVIRGGENIGCGAVEAALLEHPAVIEACVYGVPDPRLGEEVGATLQLRVPVNEAELRAFLAPHLARFEIPRYFHFQTEPLPRIASGKIFKRQLRDEAAQRLGATAG